MLPQVLLTAGVVLVSVTTAAPVAQAQPTAAPEALESSQLVPRGGLQPRYITPHLVLTASEFKLRKFPGPEESRAATLAKLRSQGPKLRARFYLLLWGQS